MILRPAREEDLPAVARLAAGLVRQHHGFDPARFMLPERVEEGYLWWFRQELDNPAALILVAQSDSEVVGYAYGRIEERNWNMLLDTSGALHDLFVDDHHRGEGIGRALALEAIRLLKLKGAPRVVLHTATQNSRAQALFESIGFRRTMVEMTRECRADQASDAEPKPTVG